MPIQKRNSRYPRLLSLKLKLTGDLTADTMQLTGFFFNKQAYYDIFTLAFLDSDMLQMTN